MPVDVLLVEDHEVVREALRMTLERDGDVRVVGAVATGAESVQFCRKNPPDLVLMDLSLPGLSGIEATKEIRKCSPGTRVVVLSMYDDEESVVGAIQAGAHGFVLKQASLSELREAIRRVAGGENFLSPRVSARLVQRIQSDQPLRTTSSPLVERLSPRETQVLRLVSEGRRSREVADLLGLEVETIRSYRKSLMKKLGVSNATQLTHIALAAGLITVEKGKGHAGAAG
jgi:DNA-binding NarL/FixJ family response regulator